jgi:hypothetical protein
MVEREAQTDERTDVGPDPVWGLGLFIIGLATMGMAGAFTWHWVFVTGEAFLLVGVVWFLAAVARTRLKQDPIVWREKLPAFLGGTPAADEPSAKPRRAKRKKAPEVREVRKKKKKKKVKKVKRRKRLARDEE